MSLEKYLCSTIGCTSPFAKRWGCGWRVCEFMVLNREERKEARAWRKERRRRERAWVRLP